MAIPLRSILITPGTRSDRYEGTKGYPADAVMFDLEDSVPADMKGLARQNWLALTPVSVREGTCVRMNTLGSVWGVEDLATLFAAEVMPEFIVVPKAESPQALTLLGEILEDAGGTTGIVALIETPAGVGNAMAMAKSTSRLVGLAFGAADYSLALGTEMEWEVMLPARSALVMAAKAAGLAIIDSPTFDLENAEQLKLDCKRAKAMGFTGKFAVHPRQLEAINVCFRPDPASVEWALKVINTAYDSAISIVTIEGMMVGPPFVKRAKLILAADGLYQ